MLSEAFKHLRKPIIKGEKITVYRFSNLESENRLRDFAVMESWGWEDVWKDMLEDRSVHRLVKDIKELMYDGWSADMVEDQLEHLTARASTRLTSEEKTVLLKWLEKNERRLKGPERGLNAFNRRQGVNEVSYHLDPKEKWGVFATGGSIGGEGKDKPYATYSDKSEARGHAKRLRKQLTPGERGYYRMGYSVRRITEVVEPLDPNIDLEDQLAELTKRMDAARRGLGLANKLSGHKQKHHRRLVMINLNKIRRDLNQVSKELENQIESTITMKPNTPARTTWLS